MKYGIVVDSSCDLKHAAALDALGIDYTRVPLFLRVGEKEFVDDADLDVSVFMAELAAWKGTSGSAAPSPERWLEAYSKSEEVFVITITSNLSGSFESANMAAELFREQYPERKIHLIDSLSTGPEMVLILEKIAACIKAGMPFEKIADTVDAYTRKTHLLFILQAMDNLVKNGRVSKMAGAVAGVLGIKVLGKASDVGTLEMLAKARGKNNVYDKAVEQMLDMGFEGGKVVISHCMSPDKAVYIRSRLMEHFPHVKVEIMPTGGLCSYYAERGGVLIGFEA